MIGVFQHDGEGSILRPREPWPVGFGDGRLSPRNTFALTAVRGKAVQAGPAPIVADRQELPAVVRPFDPSQAGIQAGRDVTSFSSPGADGEYVSGDTIPVAPVR